MGSITRHSFCDNGPRFMRTHALTKSTESKAHYDATSRGHILCYIYYNFKQAKQCSMLKEKKMVMVYCFI